MALTADRVADFIAAYGVQVKHGENDGERSCVTVRRECLYEVFHLMPLFQRWRQVIMRNGPIWVVAAYHCEDAGHSDRITDARRGARSASRVMTHSHLNCLI